MSSIMSGPMGSDPSAMFGFYERGGLFAVAVVNGKGFHTTELSAVPMAGLKKYRGMEILDVEGDGKIEIVALAEYESGAGQVRIPFQENAVVGWTGAALSKLTGYSKRIATAPSFQEARRRLGMSPGGVD